MKNTKKILAYILCLVLASIVACGTLGVGATDDPASTNDGTLYFTSDYVPSTGEDLIYTGVPTPTEGDIASTVVSIIEDLEIDDDLSNFGEDLSEFASKESDENGEGIFNSFIRSIKEFVNRITVILKRILKINIFN